VQEQDKKNFFFRTKKKGKDAQKEEGDNKQVKIISYVELKLYAEVQICAEL
jgi:hypothetical protein